MKLDLEDGYFMSLQQLHQAGKVDVFWKDKKVFEGAQTPGVAGNILGADFFLHL